MTTTRQSITRQDHPEAFPSYHAVSDAISQSHGRYGPPNHLSLPRFNDPHNAVLLNQGSLNNITYSRHPAVPPMSGSTYPFNFPANTPLPRPSFTPIASPGLWASAPPPIRQAAPLPPAQGYGMGQDLDPGGGHAKRRRMNDDGTPRSISTASTSPSSHARLSGTELSKADHSRERVDSHASISMPYHRLGNELATTATQSNVSTTYDSTLNDSLLGDSTSEGVGEWAGVGDFALFNDLHSEIATEAATSSEWSGSYIPFTDDDGGGVIPSNNLFDLKEEGLFPPIDRTSNAPTSSDLSVGAYDAKSPHSVGEGQSTSGTHCDDKLIPAVATGRPLHNGLAGISLELPLAQSPFSNSYSHDTSDLTKMSVADGHCIGSSIVSAGSLKFEGKSEDHRSDQSIQGTLSSSSLGHSSKLTESEVAGGASSDASTAPSVSDYSNGMVPMGSNNGALGQSSCGISDMKSNGNLPTTYGRNNGEGSKYGWRSIERSNQDMLSSGSSVISNEHAHRPDLSIQTLEELNDISCFKNDERYKKLIVDYTEGISFPLGEGGRELLRACLNVKGCKGRQLQGASVPALLALAKNWGLWDVAIRIKVERSCGQLCPQHDAFVKFKANQSQMRKYVKKEYMVTERDNQGCLSGIIYDERRKITLGKEGRESLRTQLRRLHDKHAGKMDDLLEKHGFKYSELRNATVQQLSRMAYVCNLWDKVVAACRKQEEKRDYRNRDINRSNTRNMKDYSSSSAPDHIPYNTAMRHESADASQRIPPGMGDAWKAAYPSELHNYGDLPANAYETDDTLTGTRQEAGDLPDTEYQSSFSSSVSDTKPNEVRVKREISEESTTDSGKRTQKPALSIEDLLSTLTVNWESPTSESIERFLQRQQEGHDTPVTEDNIFQAFSDLVPTMNGSDGRHQEPSTAGVNLGLENDSNNSNLASTQDSNNLYDNTQQNLFLNDLI